MKRIATMLVILLSACRPPAGDSAGNGAPADSPAASGAMAAPASTGWVDVPQGQRRVHTWIAYPQGDGPFPSIVVIHQNRGISDWVRGVADSLASLGYIAAAPDLLSGMAPEGGNTAAFPDPDAARQAIGELQPQQVTADLDAVADYLATQPTGNGALSVAGFCWGGSQSFRFATDRPDLVAAYVFYGTPPDTSALARIGASVYGFYGGADNRVTSTVEPTTERMAAEGKLYEPVVYDGAGHAFMSRGVDAPEGDPNRRAMEAAWERWRTLLGEQGSFPSR